MNFLTFSFILLFINHCLGSDIKYHFISEPLENNRLKFKVIAEDIELRNQQNQISQVLVYENIFQSNQKKEIEDIKNSYLRDATHLSSPSINMPNAGKPLWEPIKKTWSPQDEENYTKWFQENVNESFLLDSGILADCADLGFVFRWVYARNNKLPIANTLSGSSKLFGHFSSSSKWDKLPENIDWKKDERFKAALVYLFDHTYTWSLVNDLYPTKIDSDNVTPGSLYMILRAQSGHAQTIFRFGQEEEISTLWGNEPAAAKIFRSSIIWEQDNSKGFRRWRNVTFINDRWILKKSSEMPGYSLEQFDWLNKPDIDYSFKIENSLGIKVNAFNRVISMLWDFENSINFRRQLVALANYSCFINQCDPNSTIYNNYSTFSRDERLYQLVKKLKTHLADLDQDNEETIKIKAEIHQKGFIYLGANFTYQDLIENPEILKTFQSDPRVSYFDRWGETRETTIQMEFIRSAEIIHTLISQRDSIISTAQAVCPSNRVNCSRGGNIYEQLQTHQLDEEIGFFYQEEKMGFTNPLIENELKEMVVELEKKMGVGSLLRWNATYCESGDFCQIHFQLWGKGYDQNPAALWSKGPNDSISLRWGI